MFDQQAASYDERWARLAPVRDTMFLMLDVAAWRPRLIVLLGSAWPPTRNCLIGCGPGVAARAMLQRIGKGHLLAIDRSAKTIAAGHCGLGR